MQLFIDIDGVLLNFEHAFVRWLNAHYRLGLPEDYQAESWNFEEVLDGDLLREGWHRFLESRSAGEMVPLVAPERFNRLAAGHEVHLVTNFPEPHMPKRLENLHTLGFAYDTLHYCGLHGYKELQPRTKAQVIASLRDTREAGLFVDDHPGNCLDVHANCPGLEVWLMSRRFNRDFAHPHIRRAQGWDCLVPRLEGQPGGPAAGRTDASAARPAFDPARPRPAFAGGK